MRLAFGSVVTAELASFVGLPAAGPGGYPWQYCRAGLEYSLSSELKLNAERVSGYQYTANLISVLDPGAGPHCSRQQESGGHCDSHRGYGLIDGRCGARCCARPVPGAGHCDRCSGL